MTTEVIILAQGRQERMGDSITVPKQLLPLRGVPILSRTLTQLHFGRNQFKTSYQITIVAWHEVHQAIDAWWKKKHIDSRWRFIPELDIQMVSLLDPGNSSLKGIYRYLEQKDLTVGAPRPERTVVLLGDVVYSWACLHAIFADIANPNGLAVRFVGTSDISPSGGELWGISWMNGDGGHEVMMTALEHALAKHPPFDQTYQPGQLRRLMWALHPAYQTTPRYTAIDDYTKDIDLPVDLEKLPMLSAMAAADDREHGVTW